MGDVFNERRTRLKLGCAVETDSRELHIQQPKQT